MTGPIERLDGTLLAERPALSDERIREIAGGAFDLGERRARFAELSADGRDAVVAYLDNHHSSYRAWLEGGGPDTG